VLQVLGGIALGLIALFSSYDHITAFGRTIELQQQWGILCIAASLATVFTGCVQCGAPLGRDAELTSRSRFEQRISENQIAIERSKERTKQIESEILRVKNDSELIEKDTEQIEKETEQL